MHGKCYILTSLHLELMVNIQQVQLTDFDELRLAIRSSTVGIGCFSLCMVSLVLFVSIQILTLLVFFGTITIDLTQGVGPVTFFIMSSCSSCFISASISFHT